MDRLEENLRRVRARVDAASTAAARAPGSVTLVAVSKTHPPEAVRRLVALGQRNFGENRVQELMGKAAATADLPVRWHLVGQLQRNKAAAVARLGAVVQSVDRLPLAEALSRAGEQQERPVEVLLQVELGGPAGLIAARGGAQPAQLPALADAVAALPGVALRGVMAVAPRDADPAPAFARLAELAARLRADHPAAVEISAGMSGDLEAAIAAGATILRVGTAIFGSRPLASLGEWEITDHTSHTSHSHPGGPGATGRM